MSQAPSRETLDRLDTGVTELSAFHDGDRPGWTREVFSEPYRASRDWTAARMRDAGLEVHVDAAGNIVGRLPGTEQSAPALVTGSHTDTVDGGGRFDGIVGVLGSIEAARLLQESGTRLRRDLVVVDFLGEESNVFGLSCLGSRSAAQELTSADLDRRDYRGVTLGQAYADYGLEPSRLLDVPWAKRPLHAFVELHIEQGPTLEKRGLPLGVVTAITGIERFVATFAGAADHAGTTSMDDRRDAMVAAAEAVLAVRSEGCGAPTHGVATSTRVESESRSPNVVPSLVRMYSEVRSVDPAWLSGVKGRLTAEIAAKAAALGVDVGFEWSTDNAVVQAAPGVQDVAGAAVDALGLPWMPIPSGATHDAVHMADLAPMGMIFIPSKGGKSHCPEEWSSTADIATGVDALVGTLRRLDALDSRPS
ncbi:M20 family metallo-hydrolase [Arthrobacter sp. B0490]|uniref:M20 family metallo-hydrolase n=1 Tax=Arthrobacter sp. B0490 TaxID=2058891 RepID=UPI000CE3B958|nr:M20 family metallo-hydrolase [Arthrobacter sp. B0490]